MRSGASLACSSAIRKLLRNLPPRMVSRKCTIQLSLAFMLPIAAAAPPSAITVCALPNSDLEMMAVFRPASRASIAARSPAPPAPMTTTSYWCLSSSVIDVTSADEPQVGEPSGGDRQHIEVGHQERAQRDPGPLHVLLVDFRHPTPHPVPDGVPGEVLQPAADQVPAGV